jgi:hypothetical protein
MARGDKNKRRASGRGGSNQSNQGFKRNDNQQKSNRNKRATGGWPSEPQDQSLISEFDRSRSRPEEVKPSISTNERRFNLLVDSVPYMVTAKPFPFNGEVRYHVSVNGGSEHVFTWDSSVGQLRAIDDEASILPDNVEEAISEKLQSKA